MMSRTLKLLPIEPPDIREPWPGNGKPIRDIRHLAHQAKSSLTVDDFARLRQTLNLLPPY